MAGPDPPFASRLPEIPPNPSSALWFVPCARVRPELVVRVIWEGFRERSGTENLGWEPLWEGFRESGSRRWPPCQMRRVLRRRCHRSRTSFSSVWPWPVVWPWPCGRVRRCRPPWPGMVRRPSAWVTHSGRFPVSSSHRRPPPLRGRRRPARRLQPLRCTGRQPASPRCSSLVRCCRLGGCGAV